MQVRVIFLFIFVLIGFREECSTPEHRITSHPKEKGPIFTEAARCGTLSQKPLCLHVRRADHADLVQNSR